MKYRVTLGFNECIVEAENSSDAEDKARKEFCRMWPHHVDMIMARTPTLERMDDSTENLSRHGWGLS